MFSLRVWDVVGCNGDGIGVTYGNGHAGKVALTELIGAHGRARPPVAVLAQSDSVGLLPPVQVPRLAVEADANFLGAGADALVVATRAAAHDEDFLGAPEGVDGLAEEHGVHLLDDGDLVDAAKVEEEAVLEVGADVARVFEGVAVHENVIGADEAFHSFEHDVA